MGWLPWQRPGFDLGLRLEEVAKSDLNLKGIILEGHGLFTWGETSKDCYETTLAVLQRAADWLAENNTTEAFRGSKFDAPLDKEQRAKVAAGLMPLLRGKITGDQSKVGHFNDSAEVLQFVNSNDLEALAALGTSCPDHFLRTKIRPLVVDFDPTADPEQAFAYTVGKLDAQVAEYREFYANYYERCKRDNSPAIRDPNAVVYLVPGVGMITFA